MTKRFRILQKGTFESLARFEERLNRECELGWKAISVSGHGTLLAVLLEREPKR